VARWSGQMLPVCECFEGDTGAASGHVCPRGSAPHAPGVPRHSRFPRQLAPATPG